MSLSSVLKSNLVSTNVPNLFNIHNMINYYNTSLLSMFYIQYSNSPKVKQQLFPTDYQNLILNVYITEMTERLILDDFRVNRHFVRTY